MMRGRKPNGADGSQMLCDQVFQTVVLARRPITAAEVAELLNRRDAQRTREALFHLAQTGFLEQGKQRGKRNRPAAVFRPTLTRRAVDLLEMSN